jgi:hypothetical protein
MTTFQFKKIKYPNEGFWENTICYEIIIFENNKSIIENNLNIVFKKSDNYDKYILNFLSNDTYYIYF